MTGFYFERICSKCGAKIISEMYQHRCSPTDEPNHTDSPHCKCQPVVEGDLIIHNAWDGREFYEDGEQK